jgi:hypothetical protein
MAMPGRGSHLFTRAAVVAVAVAGVAVLSFATSTPAEARYEYCESYAHDFARRTSRGAVVGGGVRGAVGGAIIGGIADGRRGARRGARVGGAVGAIAGGAHRVRSYSVLYDDAFRRCMRR